MSLLMLVYMFNDARASRNNSEQVPLFGLFEASIINNATYANPFADVVLNTTFTAPSGRRVDFFGFYDGNGKGGQTGNVWKLRFMPDEPGTWSYVAGFSDGRPGISGSFEAVVENARPGPLRIDPDNPRWLVHANGEHFHLRGYYYSEAFSATDKFWKSDLNTFFGPDSRWKFNFASTIFWQGRHLAKNRWTARPYNGFYPVVDGDVTRLDLSAWHHVDKVLRQMASLGTVWYNFDGFIPNTGGDRPGSVDEEQIMLRNWIARVAPYWNITWNISFEWEEFMSADEVNRVARYVKSIDPWDHLMTVHNRGIGTEPDGSGDWLDFYSIQYDAGRAHGAEQANSAVSDSGDKPVFAQEVVWEGEDDGKLNDTEVRHAGWGVLTGAGLLNYAEQFRENGDIRFGDGGGFPYIITMLDTVQSMSYWLMTPRNDLISQDSKAFCLASAGVQYLVYIPYGDEVKLDLRQAGGKFSAKWLNPRTGQYSPSSTVTGGAWIRLSPPKAGNWIDKIFQDKYSNDWAIVLSKESEQP